MEKTKLKIETISSIGQIPIRNIWLLMLYASKLFRQIHNEKRSVEDNPDEIPDLVAEILTKQVERQLKRNLSFGYQSRQKELNRVRGRIDLLLTERHKLLERGSIACEFEELTVDTPRNRYVRAALDHLTTIVQLSDLAHRCRSLSTTLRQMGVVGEKPVRSELSINRYSRHDVFDQVMVTAAFLAFNLALPTESRGNKYLPLPDRDITWLRRLYEKAIAGFYNVVLSEWVVYAGKTINWRIESKTKGIDRILPSMKTDIVLDHKEQCKRIIIDTKFNSIVSSGWYREETLRSSYVYQIYAYLRSQEGNGDPRSNHASGFLLHPAIGKMIHESVVIQGHDIHFATVDLSASAIDIRNQLIDIIQQI